MHLSLDKVDGRVLLPFRVVFGTERLVVIVELDSVALRKNMDRVNVRPMKQAAEAEPGMAGLALVASGLADESVA